MSATILQIEGWWWLEVDGRTVACTPAVGMRVGDDERSLILLDLAERQHEAAGELLAAEIPNLLGEGDPWPATLADRDVPDLRVQAESSTYRCG